MTLHKGFQLQKNNRSIDSRETTRKESESTINPPSELFSTHFMSLGAKKASA
jgi:hypothetical protein